MRKTEEMQRGATRKIHHRKQFEVEHHHALFRIETQACPSESDLANVKTILLRIIKDIDMKALDDPHIYYVKDPVYNEGVTAIVPIQTSHIAFHFWNRPKRRILHGFKSKCLVQADIYTCGTLSPRKVAAALHHFTEFKPTHAEITVLNRNWGLKVERHTHWDLRNESGESWAEWLNSDRFH